jgi:hypothetical protein
MSENPELQGLTISRVERDGVLYDEGFEVGPGEQVSNVRVVCNYGTLVIRCPSPKPHLPLVSTT